jgi:hypothetical protein
LDFCVGLAQETIAIEPARFYAAQLAKKHRYFPYCPDALPYYSSKVDLAVAFEVLEHVTDPWKVWEKLTTSMPVFGTRLVVIGTWHKAKAELYDETPAA